jgi:hypothetical protein
MQKDCSTCRYENSFVALFYCYGCQTTDPLYAALRVQHPNAKPAPRLEYEYMSWKAKRNLKYLKPDGSD